MLTKYQLSTALSLRDSQNSIVQNQTIQKLTYLTIGYLPVGLVAVSAPLNLDASHDLTITLGNFCNSRRAKRDYPKYGAIWVHRVYPYNAHGYIYDRQPIRMDPKSPRENSFAVASTMGF